MVDFCQSRNVYLLFEIAERVQLTEEFEVFNLCEIIFKLNDYKLSLFRCDKRQLPACCDSVEGHLVKTVLE